MRIRSIKPDFWKSEKVAGLPHAVRLLFIGLWNVADDSGRFRAHPSLIQGEIFPYEPESPVEAWLQVLAEVGLVHIYEADGRRYGHVVGFDEHQKIDKRTESRLPPPPRRTARKLPTVSDMSPPIPTNYSAGSPEDSAGSPEWSGLDLGGDRKGEEGRGSMDGRMDGGSPCQEQKGAGASTPVPRTGLRAAGEVAANVLRAVRS